MKKYFLLLTVFVLIACSSPLDKNFNEETMEQDLKEINENGNLETEEKQLITKWVIRSKFSGESLDDKTYAEILKEAKDYEAEQEELAEKAKREEEERRQKLDAALTVAMYDKGYEEYSYQEYLTYSFAFKNKTDKKIRAFKGTISIQDLFETEIKSINLTIDEPINANETHKGIYTSDFNQFMAEDTRLKNKDLDDLVVIWNPEKIIFEDGTTIE